MEAIPRAVLEADIEAGVLQDEDTVLAVIPSSTKANFEDADGDGNLDKLKVEQHVTPKNPTHTEITQEEAKYHCYSVWVAVQGVCEGLAKINDCQIQQQKCELTKNQKRVGDWTITAEMSSGFVAVPTFFIMLIASLSLLL
jgi:hypothetical protein